MAREGWPLDTLHYVARDDDYVEASAGQGAHSGMVTG